MTAAEQAYAIHISEVIRASGPRNSCAGVNRPSSTSPEPTTNLVPSGKRDPGSTRVMISAIRR
nr:hypothetical protein [Rhodococcus marinonascens]